MDFNLFGLASGGASLGHVTLSNVVVTSGLFTVTLDFGAAFTGNARWLEVGVRPGGAAPPPPPFTVLTPRQELKPAPNAVFAATSGTVVPGGVTSGAIAAGQVVKSLNGLNDAVTIAGNGGATVSTGANTITVSAPASTGVVLGYSGDTTLIGAGYAELAPVQEFWTATALAGAPSLRSFHTAVWTGTRMIVWGGYDGTSELNTGGQYDPASNSWTATAIPPGLPVARADHTAVWTGSKMIVWGGVDGVTYLNTGGQYDPVGNTWTTTSIGTNVPSIRTNHSAVWTGSSMIVWGGQNGSIPYLNTGGRYDPIGNS